MRRDGPGMSSTRGATSVVVTSAAIPLADNIRASVGGTTPALAGIGRWVSRGAGRRTRAMSGRPRVPHLLLRLDEIAIIRRVEIKQRAARFKVLDERLANGEAGASGEHRHDKA